MTALGWERGGLALAVYCAAAAAGRFRAGRRRLAALQTPLADAAVLEAALHPRLQDGDDAALLAELREMFASVNRQADAEKFFGLHVPIAALSHTLAPAQRATLRRAILRLLASGDPALQRAGAQTAAELPSAELQLAELQLAEAVPTIRALLSEDGLDGPSRKLLEKSLAALTGAVPHS